MHVNRYQAFAIHLAASATLVGALLLLTFFVWYPAPLFQVEGTWLAIQILVGVDVVLGPFLTLVVFKPGKRSLKFDMAVIIAMQLGAFFYGAYVIFSERPSLISFAVDRFVVVSAAETKALNMDRLDTEQVTLKAIGPTYVYAERPSDRLVGQKLLQEVLEGGPDIDRRPEYFRDFHDNIERNFNRALNLDMYAQMSEEAREEIEKYFAKSGNSPDEVAVYPVLGKLHDMLLVVDRQSKSVIGYIDINPWGVNLNKEATENNE